MALESHKVPYELLLRFCPHPNRGKVGSILTYQFVEAVETVDTDTGEQVAYVPSPPVDLSPEQAQKYLGEQMATFLDGLTAERSANAAAQQKASDDLAAMKAQVATLQAANEALGGTELGQQLAAQKRLEAMKQQLIDAAIALNTAGVDMQDIAASLVLKPDVASLAEPAEIMKP